MQQRFGGMQQLLTHELPGVMSNLHDVVSDISSTLTEGMYNSFTRAGLALTSFLDNLKRTAAGQQVLGALRATFDAIGKSAERLVANLPRATEWLAKFLNSHAFQNFAGIARDALGNVWRWISEGLGWLSENWPKVWDEAKNATVGSIKVVGGAVAGLINVWREMFANHEGTDWLKAISQGFKEFAIIAVRSIGRVADQMFVFMRNFAYLGVAIGATMALFQPTRTQGLAMLGASLSSLLRSTVGQTLSRQAENTAVRGIRGLSTESITRAFAGAENRPGIGGAFIRGYNSFGSGFDQWQANLGSKFEPFKFTPFKQSEAQGDYTVPGQDETTEGGVKENPLEVLDARIGAMRAWLENTGIWKNVMTMRYLVPLLRQRVELLKGSRAETTKGMYDLVREMFATETDLQQTWEGAGGKQSAIQPMMPSIPGPLQGIFSRIAQVRQMMAANPNGANSIRSNYLIPTMRAYVPALQNALANTYNPWQREWLTQQIQNTTLEMNGMQITNGQVAPSRNAAQFTFYISGQTPEQTFKYAHQVLDNALRKMLPGPAY
jgi:hypothetical protein